MHDSHSAPAGPAVTHAFQGWRMVALGFLAVNLAIGATFGTWGVLVEPVSRELGASRSLASLGLAIVLLLMGLAGPVLGALLRHVRLRTVMIASWPSTRRSPTSTLSQRRSDNSVKPAWRDSSRRPITRFRFATSTESTARSCAPSAPRAERAAVVSAPSAGAG